MPFPSSGNPLDPGIKLRSPALQAHSLPTELWGKPKVKLKVSQSCLTLCNPMDYIHSPWNSPVQNIGVDSLSLLQGIFSTQGSNPGLPHCRKILYQLRHKGNPCKLNIVINEQSFVFIIKLLSISLFKSCCNLRCTFLTNTQTQLWTNRAACKITHKTCKIGVCHLSQQCQFKGLFIQ